MGQIELGTGLVKRKKWWSPTGVKSKALRPLENFIHSFLAQLDAYGGTSVPSYLVF
jgi:hypothetical protein